MQTWALQYLIVMEQRTAINDKLAELEFQTFNLNYDRWKAVYGDEQSEPVRGPDGEPEIPITDPRDLDGWFAQLAHQGGMSVAQAEEFVARRGAMP